MHGNRLRNLLGHDHSNALARRQQPYNVFNYGVGAVSQTIQKTEMPYL